MFRVNPKTEKKNNSETKGENEISLDEELEGMCREIDKEEEQ